jgi:hypothetical protein
MSETPKNTNSRKPTLKKSFSLADFKKKVNGEDIPEKPLEWIKCSKAFQEATGLPGFPKGYVSLSRGFTNTGKSTSVCEAAVSAQKMGILPILIDTENNMGRKRLEMMGFDWNNDFFIEIDNDYLLENFGKKRDSKVREATIEDMSECIHHFIDLQDNGELPYDLLFVIDSLGTLDCIKTVNAKEQGTSDNNMWNANAFERAFKSLINNRIPSSRKSNKPYTNTLIAVQKIWLDSMSGGQPVVKHKGGEAFAYGARLIFHHGGVLTHGTKKIIATSKNREISYGIETKISIMKNQIDGELGGIAFEGKLISTPHGFIGAESEDKDNYKKEHIKYFRDSLGSDVKPEDILTKYNASNDDMNVEEFNGMMNDM